MKIIKNGQQIKYHNYYKHKCRYCKTKFIYDGCKDIVIGSDTLEYIYCPNCGKREKIWVDIKLSKRKFKKLFME